MIVRWKTTYMVILLLVDQLVGIRFSQGVLKWGWIGSFLAQNDNPFLCAWCSHERWDY